MSCIPLDDCGKTSAMHTSIAGGQEHQLAQEGSTIHTYIPLMYMREGKFAKQQPEAAGGSHSFEGLTVQPCSCGNVLALPLQQKSLVLWQVLH